MTDLALLVQIGFRSLLAGAVIVAILGTLPVAKGRGDRVRDAALAWSTMMLVLLGTRIVMLSGYLSAIRFGAQLQYSLVLLQVPIALHLTQAPRDAHRRVAALTVTTLIAMLPCVLSGFVTDQLVQHRDALGALITYAIPGKFSALILPYSVVAGGYAVWTNRRNHDADAPAVSRVLVVVIVAAAPAGANDLLMTLGHVRSLLVVDVACCLAVLGLSFVLTRRAHDAHVQLVTAMNERESELQRGNAENRAVRRLGELGSRVSSVLAEIQTPVEQLRNELVALDETLAAEALRSADASLSQARSLIAECREAGARITASVGAFLAFAQAGSSRPRAVDVGSLVDRALAIVGNDLRHRGHFERHVPRPACVVVDPERFVQSLVGVLVRAAHNVPAASTGRIAVEVDAREGRVLLRVRDNGQASAPWPVASTFNPFVATDSGRPAAALELSTCLRVVTASGGQVRLENSALGNCVTIELPISVIAST